MSFLLNRFETKVAAYAMMTQETLVGQNAVFAILVLAYNQACPWLEIQGFAVGGGAKRGDAIGCSEQLWLAGVENPITGLE